MSNQTEHISIHMPKYEVRILKYIIRIDLYSYHQQTETIQFKTPTPGASVDVASIQNYIKEVMKCD
jgi:hypothetical protein